MPHFAPNKIQSAFKRRLRVLTQPEREAFAALPQATLPISVGRAPR